LRVAGVYNARVSRLRCIHRVMVPRHSARHGYATFAHPARAKGVSLFPLNVLNSGLFARLNSEKTVDNPGVLMYHAPVAIYSARRCREISHRAVRVNGAGVENLCSFPIWA
jgi:hypothetical protein